MTGDTFVFKVFSLVLGNEVFLSKNDLSLCFQKFEHYSWSNVHFGSWPWWASGASGV